MSEASNGLVSQLGLQAGNGHHLSLILRHYLLQSLLLQLPPA